jgi:glycosyltransferase involved in cell wall biosynthesis
MSELSLAILQRVCTGYRLELFRRLAAHPQLRVRVFIGEDLPDSKVRSTGDFQDLDVVKLPTRFLGVGRRVLPLHRGLGRALRDFDPDVILSEGESHFLGYLSAILARSRLRDCAVVHWGLGGLPGDDHGGRLADRMKRPFQSLADAFLVYSSYGAQVLERIGHPASKIVVAVNVSDTDRHLAAARDLEESRSEARHRLALPDRFTVITVGALDANKRVDVLLEAVAGLPGGEFNALIVGGGSELAALQRSAEERGLENVYLTGPVPAEDVVRYYRAADLLVVPGRGGMVISEAMAHGLPVVVHLADGTEHDLVREGETGMRLERGSAEDFRSAIEAMAKDPEATARMGENGRRLVEEEINMDAMVERIVSVCRLARERRTAG